MKKIFFSIFIIFFGFLKVYAEEDKTLYCEYSFDSEGNNAAYYMLIDFTYSNMDTYDYEFKNIDGTQDIFTRIAPNTKQDLIKYKILNESTELLQCPSLAVKTSGEESGSLILLSDAEASDTPLYIKEYSCPLNNCKYFADPQYELHEEGYTCNYKSQNSSKTILVKKESPNSETKITYPDGSEETINDGMITDSCPDIFFNSKTKKIKWGTYDYLGNITQLKTYDPDLYTFICGNSIKNDSDVEYYCNGKCNYSFNSNISCREASDLINKGIELNELCNNEDVIKTLNFIGHLLMIVKILVPIILIIMGTIDYSKALTTSEDSAIQKATKSLINRILIAIIIFIIPTIVNFVFDLLLKNSESNFVECYTCVLNPNKCNKE